jgi:hypothetical protein
MTGGYLAGDVVGQRRALSTQLKVEILIYRRRPTDSDPRSVPCGPLTGVRV